MVCSHLFELLLLKLVFFSVMYRYVAANQEMFTVEYDAAPQEYHRRMI